ncbi:MAG: CGNR zinc finger domain-containing protein [Rhizobiaceae bacterium]|nr:CGNR zinc finger domain-containing protein [Rhizobiaceae bacterium]
MKSGRSTANPRAYSSPIGRLRMLAGDPALDFANTLHWRGGNEVDFLPDYQSLIDWAVPAGLLSDGERKALVAHARICRDAATETHSAAIALRTAWRERLDRRTSARKAPLQQGVSEGPLGQMLAAALAEPRLLLPGDALAMEPASRVLALPVARIALAIAGLELIPGERKLGRCEGDPCGGFFLNTSRSKPRRWCSMDSCGNRAKVRGFRGRFIAEEVKEPNA